MLHNKRQRPLKGLFLRMKMGELLKKAGDRFGRRSIGNNDSVARSRVHFCYYDRMVEA